MTAPSFEDYLASLGSVAPRQVTAEPQALDLCERATAAIAALRPLDRVKLAHAVGADPAIVPVLAAAANFSQERFKTWLQARLGTAGWIRLGRERPAELVDALDEELGLVALLEAQIDRNWTWADVLARVMAPRQRAGTAIQQGRDLEDDVEAVIAVLQLPFVPRTRFEGTGGQTAPADFAIPGPGDTTLVAVGVKGFDSRHSREAARAHVTTVNAARWACSAPSRSVVRKVGPCASGWI